MRRHLTDLTDVPLAAELHVTINPDENSKASNFAGSAPEHSWISTSCAATIRFPGDAIPIEFRYDRLAELVKMCTGKYLEA